MKINLCVCYVLLFFVLKSTAQNEPNFSLISSPANTTLAELSNEYLKVSFLECRRNNKKSVYPKLEVQTPSGWVKVPMDPSAESYQVLSADTSLEMGLYQLMHPKWRVNSKYTRSGENDYTKVIWNAGENNEFTVKRVRQISNSKVELEFYSHEKGKLKAFWSLAPNDKTVKVHLQFVPLEAGQYSLGYFLFRSEPIDQVNQILMPMLVQQKRFPVSNYTQLSAASPTPVSLMEITESGQTFTWGVSGDPDQTPFEFPVPINSRYGLHIKNQQNKVQPSIFGPLLGTDNAKRNEREPVEFTFRVFVENGGWYAAYRDIADNVFGLRDYRKNGQVSMTTAVYNMIDLYMDDENGGWWSRAKANYQIESKNGSTQSSPLAIASLYRLTGDTSIYRRRTLPTLEFILSRDNPHFSPEPENTGGYNRGHMNGPVDIFGATVYGGLWEMLNRRTPILKDIAFPNGKLNLSTTQQGFIPHIQPFDEWLGKYCFTNDEAALDSAKKNASAYIKEVIERPQEEWISLREFFLMAYTPDWEGLLRMYEITGDESYLDAAEKGARIAMTGMWTQPMPKNEMITIHKNNEIHGDKMDRWLHKGEEEYRLGFPIADGSVIEKQVPAWLVSNVGLGFEQPSTYTYKSNGGRMILQANWTSAFLRLAQYTGDRQFETYARNAALGRVGNYAGYYYTTFTDLMQNPDYPYQGPDVSFIYFHHLPVHLSWSIDYLVSEAQLASGGKIHFPSLRQFGYAYFDNLVYGHAPGEVFGQKDVWLWFDRDLVQVDNPQINYLTAHSKDKLYVIMMNESGQSQKSGIKFNPKAIDKQKNSFDQAQIITDNNEILTLTNNTGEIDLEPRALKVVMVDGLNIEVNTHEVLEEPSTPSESPYFVEIDLVDSTKIRGVSIQVTPGEWQAYIYSTADFNTLKNIDLFWETQNDRGRITDRVYPYEFSIPVKASEETLNFSVEIVKNDGQVIKTEKAILGVVK